MKIKDSDVEGYILGIDWGMLQIIKKRLGTIALPLFVHHF
jgi:hypothetical protein